MSDIATTVTIQGLRVARDTKKDDYPDRLDLDGRVERLESLVLSLIDLLEDNGIKFDD